MRASSGQQQDPFGIAEYVVFAVGFVVVVLVAVVVVLVVAVVVVVVALVVVVVIVVVVVAVVVVVVVLVASGSGERSDGTMMQFPCTHHSPEALLTNC